MRQNHNQGSAQYDLNISTKPQAGVSIRDNIQVDSKSFPRFPGC